VGEVLTTAVAVLAAIVHLCSKLHVKPLRAAPP
jgi:hypothetical protein